MTGLGRPKVDVAVVGAGIVGLAAAMNAADRGLRVAVVERDERAVGASVQNFGHIGTTVQAGLLREYADAARLQWLALGAAGVVDVQECGTLVVARADDELQVLRELRQRRGDEVRLLTAGEVAHHFRDGADIVGGAMLDQDLRVDPRTTAGSIAGWLDGRGVEFHWSTVVGRIEPGVLLTSRGPIEAEEIVVAIGHEVDTLFPATAQDAGVERCTLSMLAVANPLSRPIEPAVLTGHSMLRYPAFVDCPTLPALRARIKADDPAAIRAELNLMSTQLPTGELILGDTHSYQRRTVSPFQDETNYRLLLRAGSELFGAGEPQVIERWQGVYASAPSPFLVAHPDETTTVLSVTTGVGMTTAFGFVSDALATSSISSSASNR